MRRYLDINAGLTMIGMVAVCLPALGQLETVHDGASQVASLQPDRTRPVVEIAQSNTEVIDLDADLTALSEEELRVAYEDTFRALLRAPQDIDVLLRFVSIAVRIGEFETAIGQLERLLLISPELSIARAQLGILYFRLGSFDVASAYLREALADDSLDADVRAAAETALGAAQESIVQFDWSATVTVGARYQTNAIAASSENRIVSFGQEFASTNATDPDADLNGFLSARATANYDFLTQRELSSDTVVTFFTTRQNSFSNLDITVTEINQGLDMVPFPLALPQLSVRPHMIGTVLLVDNHLHSWAWGTGIDVDLELYSDTLIQFTYQYRSYTHDDIRNAPDNKERTGDENLFRANLIRQITPRSLAVAGVSHTQRSARVPWNVYNETGLSGQYIQVFDAPFSVTDDPWRATVFGTLSQTLYDREDLDVQPNEVRQDWSFTLGARQSVPVLPDINVTAEYSFQKNNSNIPNYVRNNHRMILSGTVNF